MSNREGKYGKGPWYVALLFEVQTQRQTRYVHTYAYKATAVMNALHPTDEWMILELIGPFDSLDDALANRQPADGTLYSWSSGARRFLTGTISGSTALNSMSSIGSPRE